MTWTPARMRMWLMNHLCYCWAGFLMALSRRETARIVNRGRTRSATQSRCENNCEKTGERFANIR